MNKIVTIGRGPLAAAILAVLLGACGALARKAPEVRGSASG